MQLRVLVSAAESSRAYALFMTAIHSEKYAGYLPRLRVEIPAGEA